MRILVTGSTGFIGKNIVPMLKSKGYTILEGSRKHDLSKSQVFLDMTDLSSINQSVEDIDVVIHLAGATSEKSHSNMYEVNVLGLKKLLRVCKKKDVGKFIYVSTQSLNKSPYAVTKRKGERLVKGSGLDFVILRPSITYGLGSNGLFNKILSQVKSYPIIPLINNGNVKVNPLFVKDIGNAILQILEKDVMNKEYNISGPDIITFRDFMLKISKLLEKDKLFVNIPSKIVLIPVIFLEKLLKNPPITYSNLEGYLNYTIFSNNKIINDLGIDLTSLDSGLKKSLKK